MANQTPSSKDIWQKLQAVSALVAAVVIPIVLFIVGNRFVSAEKASDLRLKYVEVALAQLEKKPSDDTKAIRVWAVDILAEYSPVRISEDAKQEMKLRPIQNQFEDNSYDSSGNWRWSRNPSIQSTQQPEGQPPRGSAQKP